MKKILTILGVCVIVGAIAYNYFSPKFGTIGTGSAIGTTNSTQRIAQAVCNNQATTTYVSFLNSNATDRVMTSIELFMTGYQSTTTLFAVDVGTSTVAVGTSSTNYFLHATNGQIATSTDPVYFASTTPTTTNGNRIWATGSYLNVVANATTTGYCTVKINYFQE